jgi:cysteinyl-tRNA synthetase
MIALVQKLMEKGVAYQSEDGSVYFKVREFPGYGKLAHIDFDNQRTGLRCAADEYDKENVGDFALWKAWEESDGPVGWDSPWGRGRPGWHIECSAMSMKYLGETFDIHTGGIDNLFPHHANETAQAEGATGKPFVNCWLHCAHLRLNGEKMSKSLGNFYTLRDLLAKGWTGREIRFVLVGGHYRQVLNFTFDALAQARTSLARIDAFVSRLREVVESQKSKVESPDGQTEFGQISYLESAQGAFEKAISDDLNMPEALAALFGLIRDGNTALDAAASGVVGNGERGTGNGEPSNRQTVKPSNQAFEATRCLELLRRMDAVFGFIFSGKADEALPAEIQTQLDARAAARKAKQWAESDRIRDALRAAGWEVKDTPSGQKIRRI